MRCVFEVHEPRIRAFARGMLGSVEDAEEVSVATFLRFWRTAGRFRGDCSLKAYLTRIALNLARDRIRKRGAAFPLGLGRVPRAVTPDPAADRIHEAMASLEPADREILALYYLEETDYEELMDLLGVSYDVVRTRLVRARQRLRKLMEETDGRS
jgi:RNA polymerase sigma-70 factor (ECF subfamily)